MSITYPSVASGNYPNSTIVWQPMTSKIPNAKWCKASMVFYNSASAPSTYTIDLGTANSLAQLGTNTVQSIFVDASQCTLAPTYITFSSGQKIKIKPGTQGYYPIVGNNSSTITVTNLAIWLASYNLQNQLNQNVNYFFPTGNPYNCNLTIFFFNVPFTTHVYQVSEQQVLPFVSVTPQITTSTTLPYSFTLINIPASFTIKNASIQLGAYAGATATAGLVASLITGSSYSGGDYFFLQGQWIVPTTEGSIKGDTFAPAVLANPVCMNVPNSIQNFVTLVVQDAFAVATFNAYLYVNISITLDDIYPTGT